MGRKNQRERYEPVDYTGVDLRVPPAPSGRRETQAEYHMRHDRQRLALAARGIDWSVCLVPGCTKMLTQSFTKNLARKYYRNDPAIELPLCGEHLAAVFQQALEWHKDHPEFVDLVADIHERIKARREAAQARIQAEYLADTANGDIYFVRLNGLVKVGWTRDLWKRLKAYGASAEVICSYHGSRDDETNLHRQLRPVLAKGREWYEDGPIIASFIALAFKDFGAVVPDTTGMWTQPKRIVAGKRHRA